VAAVVTPLAEVQVAPVEVEQVARIATPEQQPLEAQTRVVAVAAVTAQAELVQQAAPALSSSR
jgi:hypothetical protein